MNDKEFKILIQKTQKTFRKFKRLLAEAEEEYVNRFGNYPSDVDDDFWIDTMHKGEGETSFKKIIESANMHRNNFK